MPFSRTHLTVSDLPSTIRAKWADDLLCEGFLPFSKRALRALPLLFPNNDAVRDLGLLMAVIDYRREHAVYPPSLEILGFIAGLDAHAVTAALASLVGRGWVTTEPIKDRVSVTLEGFFDAVRSAAPEEPPHVAPKST